MGAFNIHPNGRISKSTVSITPISSVSDLINPGEASNVCLRWLGDIRGFLCVSGRFGVKGKSGNHIHLFQGRFS
jgi:hypothetical protein